MGKVILPVLLAAAAATIAVGVFLWSVPAGWVTSGVLGACWSVLFFLDVAPPVEHKIGPVPDDESGGDL